MLVIFCDLKEKMTDFKAKGGRLNHAEITFFRCLYSDQSVVQAHSN